jgi:two-component system LytT family sensor kinase
MVHGIEQLAGDALVRIEARREGEQLLVEVRDNGRGATKPTSTRRAGTASTEGIGLSNTRARLEKLYDGRAHLEFSQPATGGTVVVVRVPYEGKPAPRHVIATPEPVAA